MKEVSELQNGCLWNNPFGDEVVAYLAILVVSFMLTEDIYLFV